jgi:hypothetical protein
MATVLSLVRLGLILATAGATNVRAEEPLPPAPKDPLAEAAKKAEALRLLLFLERERARFVEKQCSGQLLRGDCMVHWGSTPPAEPIPPSRPQLRRKRL